VATSAGQTGNQEQPGLLAAPWHTAVVLLLLFGIAALTAWGMTQLLAKAAHRFYRLESYTLGIVYEWLIVAFIAWGVRRGGRRISDLVGGSWPTARAVLRDLGLAFLFLFGSGVIVGALQFAMRNRPNPAVRSLLPETPLEIVFWIALSATAGFCEETIFRGYLQRQLGAFTGNPAAGLVLQGVIFGVCHGYQGAKSIVALGVYGCLFGLLAQQRRSLRPGIIAHFLQDGVGGLLLRAVLKRLPAG